MAINSQKYIKPLVAFGITAMLFFPILQSNIAIFEISPLYGDTTIVTKPALSIESYLNSSWQEGMSAYLNRNFGFRTFYVKLYNQLRYSLFNKAAAPGIVIAKNGDLIVEDYINEYTGKNFLGKVHLSAIVQKIKTVQDTLKSRGIDLIVVFAPGKASFDPGIIPDAYLKAKKDSTNYSVYRSLMLQSKINFIDFNAWFHEKKPVFKHKVYPKYGAHWNHYGMSLALDSLVKYIEKQQNADLPDFDFSEVKWSTELKGNDFDIGILMNTLIPIQKDSNPYPVYKVNELAKQIKPDVLFVGDSYWWCVVGENLPLKFFREDEYWFYNKQQLIQNRKTSLVHKLNLQTSLAYRNTVVIIASEATYYLFPFGFIDNVHKLYCEDHSKRLDEIKAGILTNPEWYNSVLKKAGENHVTVEKQIKLDAEYILSDELFDPKLSIDSITKLILKNEKWMEDIRSKSMANNISIEDQVKLDAKWYFDNQNK